MSTEEKSKYHRRGEPGGPACPVGVLQIRGKASDGSWHSSCLLDAGNNSSEVEILRTIASRFGVQWGHDDLGWWAAVPGPDFPSWVVWRQDDNANKFLMHFNLTESEAKECVQHYEGLGHKQLYWAENVMNA
jgi:hypothetical protein